MDFQMEKMAAMEKKVKKVRRGKKVKMVVMEEMGVIVCSAEVETEEMAAMVDKE